MQTTNIRNMLAVPYHHARGVYLSPGIGPRGEQHYIAVDSLGGRIIELVVFPGQPLTPIESSLWELLDKLDPAPAAKTSKQQVALVI
jgi:hypothetical protein